MSSRGDGARATLIGEQFEVDEKGESRLARLLGAAERVLRTKIRGLQKLNGVGNGFLNGFGFVEFDHPAGFLKIDGVYLVANAVDAQFDTGHGGGPDSQKGIEDALDPIDPVELDTHFGNFNRECGRMGALGGPAADGFIGHKPGIASTPAILSGFPSLDIGFVLVFYPNGQAIELDILTFCEVEMYSWQSFRKRGLLMGLKCPTAILPVMVG